MTTVQIPTRRLIFASAVAMVLALAPMIAGPTVAPHAIAQECTGSDTPDDYTLHCAPAAVPDFNDQLSEAEVAEPGFNGHRAVVQARGRSWWRRWTSLSNYPISPSATR